MNANGFVRLTFLVGALVLGYATHAAAQTPDGLTPAVETVCDGFEGRAFGLCNAYCEAMDCDLEPAPGRACEAVRNNYFKLTAESAMPCEDLCPVLPDPTCSGNGSVGTGADGCDVCLCLDGWTGSDCATCEGGFDERGNCIPLILR